VPGDTDDSEGPMAALGKMLIQRATELTTVIANDLATGLNLASPTVQHEVISAIGAAKADLEAGLAGLSIWKTIDGIRQAFTDESIMRISAAVASARVKGDEALAILERSSQDSKFQLKALAALWHSKHMTGTIDDCPLCENDIKSRPTLAQELEALRSAGDAAARSFDDNLNNILAELDTALPASMRRFDSEVLKFYPRAKLINEIRGVFVTKERYTKILTKYGALVEAALPSLPGDEIVESVTTKNEDVLTRLNQKISVIDRLLALANWFSINENLCSTWWQELSSATQGDIIEAEVESIAQSSELKTAEKLSTHLNRLSDALEKAEPYRRAAELMRKGWKAGLTASKIQKELNKREAIAESLATLKNLAPYSEAMARETIEGLSDRISKHLKNTLLTEQFHFSGTRLDRKEGLIVRGGFEGDFLIDATLVANTSWLRAVLWAFIFALRSEAIEQFGSDPFPLLVFDDPQSTFDFTHRHRWAQHIASLQNDPSRAQVILTSHDEIFLELIKVSGVSGRQAMIAAASKELGFVGIFEGQSLDREWMAAKSKNTGPAGLDYVSKVRKYLEGLLRLMLRGEDANILSAVNGFVVGQCREKIQQLHNKGIAPWDRSEFKSLVGLLHKDKPAIKHMEMSHHASASHLGMAEATDVEQYWRKSLAPGLDSAFRLAREYHHLHGGLRALRAPAPIITLPEGYQSKVRTIPLKVLGRAAAMSNGRAADGLVDMNEFSLEDHKKIVLAQHLAFRLTAPTLEPVAKAGDIVLLKTEGEPEPRSLVVAIVDDRMLARRFDIADNHSDVAVLTAQSINPNEIASPFIAHKASLRLHKIIGVLYENSFGILPSDSNNEIIQCNGEADVTRLASDALGLVEVGGDSAEPIALHGQYLITKKEISVSDALTMMVGRPIIAADTNENYYFKRLRVPDSNQIILESLDSGGFHDPVLLATPGNGVNCLARVCVDFH